MHIRASGAATLELCGLPFAVTLGVPRQAYQHVVSTVPKSCLDRMRSHAASKGLIDADMEDEPPPLAVAGVGEEEAPVAAAQDPSLPSAFVIAGPVAFSLSVCPDLENLLKMSDEAAQKGTGPHFGGQSSASAHLVNEFLKMPTGKKGKK
jgi:hypothetical protein